MPSASPRSRLDHDQRRRQILDSAASLLAARPYGEVSMEDVAAAAGVTRGLLHHYFGTKRDLQLELTRDMLRAIPVPIPEFRQGVTPEQRLADSVDRWLDAIWRNRRMWLATVGGAGLGRDPEAERIWDRARDASVDSMIGVLGLGPADEASSTLRGLLRSYAAFAETATREWLAHKRFTREQMQALLTSSLSGLVADVLPLIERQDHVRSGERAAAEALKRL
ncbi:MAG TPA: TetR/AcrR family transcriptional regulator [Solirubrobacteraceae bacterium]